MIIEFKRIGLINPGEFSLASRATLEEGRKWLDKKLGATLNAKQNAYVLTQQAAAYRYKWRCPYIALCDYDNLVLFRFDKDRDFAYTTTVTCTDMRKALLIPRSMWVCADSVTG
jgi:hypothetical protein